MHQNPLGFVFHGLLHLVKSINTNLFIVICIGGENEQYHVVKGQYGGLTSGKQHCCRFFIS